ncbi:MAG: cysteine--tRNA ligase [Clostridia bacterium]|nr:cysteine--tRNA ligase [Clostridia bacterium]
MKIYNTLTRKKEEFQPLNDNSVKMYACGITVSGEAHIGHAIQAVIFDIIRKYLEKKGYNVTYARNYTDVDDKIIAKANELGIDATELARANIKKTDEDMLRLGVDEATMTLKATEHIKQIIEFVQILIDKNYAYSTEKGDVYFSVEKFKDYGKLSNRTLEDALDGVRVENEENKKSPYDFALWKSAKPNEIFWESPWGKGRPGWHIECSVMNYYNLGEQIDIHGGGRDLIFPHHENEIAQTESLTGKQFAKYWVHNGLVRINGQKMSKSLNNSIYLNDLLNQYDREVIKFALLQTNYRNDINITEGLFENSKKHLLAFYKILKEIEELGFNSNETNKQIDEEFNEAMDDDFNTAKALAKLYGYFKTMQQKLLKKDDTVIKDYNAIRETYRLLGIFTQNSDEFIKNNKLETEIPNEIKELAKQRWQAKQDKNWVESDRLRLLMQQKGYDIKDLKDDYEIFSK